MTNQPVTPTKPATKRKAKKVGKELTIRMYDVGFGDCFLLSIPQQDEKKINILFDCGTIKYGRTTISLHDVVSQVINDVKVNSTDTPRIDVIVATHRHKDHISGFDDPLWASVEVGEVWMPWTEKQEDPQAQRIRALHTQMAETLVNRLFTANMSTSVDEEDPPSLEMARNALSNEGAMQTLYDGFCNETHKRYLPEENAATNYFTTPVLPGVTIHVLGPSRDEKVINEMDPPAGESYLRMINTGNNELCLHPKPFGKDWVIDKLDYGMYSEQLYSDLPTADLKSINKSSSGLDENMAALLDTAINGTSLVLVFEIGNATLLFAGDAQWGTWRLALENPNLCRLLEKVNFYKVGHHGSHNATPVKFVENLKSQDMAAMISVTQIKKWPMVPKSELILELQKKAGCKIARSDKPDEAKNAGYKFTDVRVIEAKIPF